MTLSDVTSELFIYLVVFRRKLAEKVPVSIESVAHDLELIFARVDQKAAADPVLSQRYPAVRKILAIIADGIIVGSDWEFALDYRLNHLLENKFYKSNEGGDRFFDDLNKLSGDEADLREVYFTALALGFQGRYSHQPEIRMDLKKKLYLSLPQRVLDSADKVTPKSYEYIDSRDCTVPPVVRLSRYAIVFAGIILFFLILGRLVYKQQTTEIDETIASMRRAKATAALMEEKK